MELPSELISAFAKITNDEKPKNSEGSTAYGRYVVQGDKAYVQIDGSNLLTPVATTAECKNGDRVTLMIKDHKAVVTGNFTDPSVSGTTLDEFKMEVGNDLSGENLITRINMTPGNILIEAEHINLVGAVTAETIAAGALEVGKNVTMGPDAIISWNNLPSNVASSGEIPSDSEITQITQNAITTGDIIIGGYVYDKTTTGKQIILGVNSSNNLQVGTIVTNANYDKMRFYAPEEIEFYPNGVSADDGYFLQIGGDMAVTIRGDTTIKNGDIYMHSGFDVRNLDNTVKYASKSHTHSDYYGYGESMVCQSIRPHTDGSYGCGLASYRWSNVYCKNAEINTSDRNLKENIEPVSNKYIAMFDVITPVSYKLVDGDRTHIGFVSQEVEEKMAEVGLTDMDFGGFCKDLIDDGEGNFVERYGLRYGEFIGIMAAKIKQLESRIIELESKEVG